MPLELALLLGVPPLALVLGLLLRWLRPQWTHLPLLASSLVAALSGVSLAARVASGFHFDRALATWMAVGGWEVTFGARADGLTATVLAMVAVVSLLIHFYASSYMKSDPGFSRFFLLFHLFFFAMTGLLLSNNYVQLYLFWELVGICSYFLIGYWYRKESARRAALQALLANRVGDFGLLFATLLLVGFADRGGARFEAVFSGGLDPWLVSVVAPLLLLAAASKSAQFPLHFWLPDAMEGPTPVSALMHAATMVTAGIFVLARSWPILASSPELLAVLMWIGGLTALGSALIASMKTDLKRILAYSTVSHLGLMAFALGLGQVPAAIFHLVTHGFFKALLFLTAGNVAHGLGRPTVSIEETGGLARAMPLTALAFTVGALSLAGIWPFAGFYSKDAILDAALHHGFAAAALAVAVSVLSAFYVFRLGFFAFLGPRPDQKLSSHVHEASPAMAIPCVLLAVGALAAGWLGGVFDRTLAVGWPLLPGPGALPAPSSTALALGTGAALAGIVLAYAATTLAPRWDWMWRLRNPGLVAAFESDFGWRNVVAGFARAFGAMARGIGEKWDRDSWDRFLESLPRTAERSSIAAGRLATGRVNDYLWWMVAGAAAVLIAAVLR